MLTQTLLTALLAASAVLATPVRRQVAPEPSIILSLQQTDSAVQRNQILAANGGNSSFAFNFNSPPAAASIITPAGNITQAVGATFPALTDINAGLLLFNLEPCSMILPHLHPRSDEFIIVTQGTIFTQFIAETGAVLVTNNLTTLGSTLFPKGSIHVEYNPTCEKAQFIGALNSNDPGVSFVAANFLDLNDQLVIANLGGEAIVSGQDLESVRAGLPAGVATGVQSCLTACGLNQYAKRSLNEVFARK